jgi:outer membrane receptor protein involved in Fe transport
MRVTQLESRSEQEYGARRKRRSLTVHRFKLRVHLVTVVAAAAASYGVATASPDGSSVRTLRMRAGSSHAAPARVRLAMKKQPAPTPAPAPTPDQPAPPEGGTPAPTPPEGGTPAPAPTPPPEGTAPAPEGTAPAGNTDEELAKMAAEAEKAAETGEGTVGSEVIEVTGSLVDRKTLDTPAPVQVLDRQTLQSTGEQNVGTILQFIPAQFGGSTVNINNGGDGSTRVSLRGLGTQRTLVLLNGRRMVPSGLGADSSVDLSVLPTAMIERIEILKDGASAIYGSDAIGGVVNVITRKDFSGTEASLYTGETSHSDGFTYDASIVTGATSSKGNVIFSAGYTQQDPIFAGDRDFSRSKLSFSYKPSSYGKISEAGSFTIPNGELDVMDGADPAVVGAGNALWNSLQAACPSGFCTRDNNNAPWRDLNTDGNSDSGKGDLYNFQPVNYLRVPLRKYNVFTQGTYKLSDHINAEFEGLYVNRANSVQLASEPVQLQGYNQPLIIDRNSIYNPFARDVTDYGRRLVESGPRRDQYNVDMFRLVGGLQGEIPEDAPALKNWKWELSYNFGRTQATDIHQGSLIVSHMATALGPSYYDATGAPKCGTPMNPGPADCVPLNLLGTAGSITPDQLRYIEYTGTTTGYSDQKTALAQAHGQLAKTPWDGDIALAVGADYRKESGAFVPDPLVSTGDTTNPPQQPTSGAYDVAEAFGELSIVPVTNRKAAKYLELDGAFRAYDYNTFGSGATWKGSVLYKVPQGIAVRGTYSTAFRAPSVGELYGGQAQSFPSAVDPCDTSMGAPSNPTVVHNCYAPVSQGGDGLPMNLNVPNPSMQLKSLVGGNPNLQPETANILTGGIVIEPSAVKGLGVTLDYFKIKLDQAISVLGAQTILDQCYASTNRQFCNLITRNPQTHGINLIQDTNQNVNTLDTSGIDFSIGYNHDAGKLGRWRLMFDGTYLMTYDQVTPQGKQYGIGNPDLGAMTSRVRTTTTVMWGKGGFNGGFTVHEIGGGKECGPVSDCSKNEAGVYKGSAKQGGTSRGIDYAATGDIFLSYSVKNSVGVTTIAGGVNNVADSPPPWIYSGFAGNSDQTIYDYMGRFGYLRLTQTF